MNSFIEITKALSDPSRVRALLALRGRELCVCQLNELLGLAPSTVSKHMSILRQAGLVASRKEGRWAYYRRVGKEASGLERSTFRWLDNSLSGSVDYESDLQALERILQVSPEVLCQTQGGKKLCRVPRRGNAMDPDKPGTFSKR